MILCLTEQLTIQFIAFHALAGIECAFEERTALGILQIDNTIVGDEAARILHAIALKTHGNIGVSIIGIEDIDKSGVLFALTIHDNTQQIHLAIINVMVKHHQREQIVGTTAEIAIKDHRNRLFFHNYRFKRHLLRGAALHHQRQYKQQHTAAH